MKTFCAIVLVGAAACGEDKAAPAAAQSFDAAAECTYSLPDSTTPMQLAQVLNDVKQGNLDPCLLFGPIAEIERRATDVLARAGGKRHVFNLGHGILPPTPPEHAIALVDIVHRLGASNRS